MNSSNLFHQQRMYAIELEKLWGFGCIPFRRIMIAYWLALAPAPAPAPTQVLAPALVFSSVSNQEVQYIESCGQVIF